MYLTVDYRSYGRDLCVCSKCEIIDSYPFFVVGILHVISSAVLGFGALLLVYKAVSLGGIYSTSPFWMFPTRLPTSRPWLIQGEGWTLLMFRAVSMMSGV